YDSAMFPIAFGNDLGEQEAIDIHRICPDDADARREDVPVNGSKVKGEALGAFAAFLDPAWRRNDILWGRLDGAQRLIEMGVPAHDAGTQDLRRRLIDMAHEEITIEYLELPESDRPNWKRKLRDYIAAVPQDPQAALVARSASRATAVTGALLEDIAETW